MLVLLILIIWFPLAGAQEDGGQDPEVPDPQQPDIRHPQQVSEIV